MVKTTTLLSLVVLLASLSALGSARTLTASSPSDDDAAKPLPVEAETASALLAVELAFAGGFSTEACKLKISPVLITGYTPFDLACRMRIPPGVSSISNLEIVMWDSLGNLKNVAWLPGTIYTASGAPVSFTMPYPQGIDHPHGSEDAWIVRARYTDQFGNHWRSTLCGIAVD